MDLEQREISNIKENSYKIVLRDYNFTSEDAQNLKDVSFLLMQYIDDLKKGFYKYIFKFDHASTFLDNQDVLSRHNQGIENWFRNLFVGTYDESYFEKLNKISETHVTIGLPPHYVNSAFSFIRSFVQDILIKEGKVDILPSWHKIIDINLDILTITYREEEGSKLIDEVIFLRDVVENDNIYPFVQEIVNIKEKQKFKKYEALMRLKDSKTGKYLSVFPYLKVAQNIKLYNALMYSMVNKCFDLFEDSDTSYSINLSYEDIANDEFKAFLYDKIQNASSPQNIVFEILETDFIEDVTIINDFKMHVKQFGSKIAIDDFGAGYSNMENIVKLKPDFIKIDGSLIKNLDESTESKTIVKNIVNMSKELGIKTVAEFVHKKEILDIVKDLDIDFVQGFYLDEPSLEVIV